MDFEKRGNIKFAHIRNVQITPEPFSTACDLTLIEKENLFHVVITQPKDHIGRSITNGIELIRESVNKTLYLDVDPVWIEHYPKGFSILGEKYTLMEVEFREGEPSWSSLTTWEQLATKYEIPPEIFAYGYESELIINPRNAA